MIRRLAALVGLLLALSTGQAFAHEARPGYLIVDQSFAGQATVTWKQPAIGEYALWLVPHLSTGWLEGPPAQTYLADGYVLKIWRVPLGAQAEPTSLGVRIEGLSRSLTDVIVKVKRPNGGESSVILKPDHDSATVVAGASRSSAGQFLLLGVQHILQGPDHLLFVLGLMLIVADVRALAKTITGFTVAHSLTLALATFGYVSVNTALLNTLVALSILFLAPEVVRARRGGTSFTLRHPWLIAFGFGLLHGLGFASGLTALDLPRPELALALVMFNLGVELGQLAFIGVVLALTHGFELMQFRFGRLARAAPVYCIGVLGVFWTVTNGLLLFGVSL